MNIKDFPILVRETASVIGLRRAKVAIKKAIAANMPAGISDSYLYSAMVWSETPQGLRFWSEISRKSGLTYVYPR